jgi:hypothetical protein
VNTLFLDSALGTQLPDIHLHLFYIKKCWQILSLWNIEIVELCHALISWYFYRQSTCASRLFKSVAKIYYCLSD